MENGGKKEKSQGLGSEGEGSPKFSDSGAPGRGRGAEMGPGGRGGN